jgi:hypothetical protein
MGLKENFIAYHTRKAVKKQQFERPTVNYDSAQRVGILFCTDTPQKHELVKQFKKKLEAEGKKVSVLTFLKKGQENYGFNFDYFGPEDFSFFGNLKSEAAKAFCDQKFDYLFHVDLDNNHPMLSYVLAHSHAKSRVGRYADETKEFYELMISLSEEKLPELIEQMYRYTKILSTNAA